jgi:rhodanese-related sulfurtransferase
MSNIANFKDRYLTLVRISAAETLNARDDVKKLRRVRQNAEATLRGLQREAGVDGLESIRDSFQMLIDIRDEAERLRGVIEAAERIAQGESRKQGNGPVLVYTAPPRPKPQPSRKRRQKIPETSTAEAGSRSSGLAAELAQASFASTLSTEAQRMARPPRSGSAQAAGLVS